MVCTYFYVFLLFIFRFSSYNCNVKKGSSKKIFFGIVSAFFVLLALLAPNYKNEEVQAQAVCTITSGRFEPAFINDDVDEEFIEKWYEGKTPSPNFDIKFVYQNCVDEIFKIVITERDLSENLPVNITGSDNKEKDYVAFNQPNSSPSGTIFSTFTAGSDKCDIEIGADCELFFYIYNKNGDKLFDSMVSDKNIAQGGMLGYDEGDSTKKPFKYINSIAKGGDQVGTRWFYKLTNGKYVLSGDKVTANTKLDCEKEAEGVAAAEKPANCTDSPALDKIVGGALNGISSIVPHCELSNPAACVTDVIFAVVFMPLSFLAGLAGQFFDLLFSFSISSEIYGGGGADIGFLKVAWTFIRDICNLGFILTLLWISILQIISPDEYNAKKQIPDIIIIALLINFSYFFGTIIIDATNVLARFLYTNDAICVNTAGVCDGSISEGIVAAFNPQTMIDKSSDAFLKATGQTTMDVSFYAIILILSIWASWKMFMMFFKIATVFLGRIVQLWVHLVLSPVAFINMILPMKIKSGNVAQGPIPWATEFFKNAFIAPLFMFFMYLIFLMLSKFDVAKVAFASHGHGSFLVILTMVFPFFVITMLMDSAIDVTTKQAGSIAGKITGMINGAIGAVAGTALALGGGAVMGAVVKGGGAVLGRVGKSMVGREGKGSNMLSRSFNSRVAKMGGRVNQYSKDLPNKNFDIRKSALASQIKGATGFDMTTGQGDINKWLRRGGLRPDENYTQQQNRKKKDMLDDIERRKVSEKSEKSDRELKALAEKREKKMQEEMLKNDFSFGRKYQEAKDAALASGQAAPDLETFKKDYLNQNYKAEMEAYKIKKAGSVEMFEAQNNDAYSKAAKNYNKEVKKAYVEKKKRDVYGATDTQARYEANQQAGFANTGDLAGAGGRAAGLGALASTVAAGTGIGLAGAVVYTANARADREADLAFLREQEVGKSKAKKTKEAVEKIEVLNNRKEAQLADLTQELKMVSNALKQNSNTYKDATGNMQDSFKKTFDSFFGDLETKNNARSEEEKWSAEKLDSEAFKEAYKKFVTDIGDTMTAINTELLTATGAREAELEANLTELGKTYNSIKSDMKDFNKASTEYDKVKNVVDKHKETIKKLNEELGGGDKKDGGGDKKEEKK